MLKVAVVDDEERIRLGLAKLLSRYEGRYEVTATFAGGQELLEWLESGIESWI